MKKSVCQLNQISREKKSEIIVEVFLVGAHNVVSRVFIYIYKNHITTNDVMLIIGKGLIGKGSRCYSNCQTRTMAANGCWIRVRGE